MAPPRHHPILVEPSIDESPGGSVYRTVARRFEFADFPVSVGLEGYGQGGTARMQHPVNVAFTCDDPFGVAGDAVLLNPSLREEFCFLTSQGASAANPTRPRWKRLSRRKRKFLIGPHPAPPWKTSPASTSSSGPGLDHSDRLPNRWSESEIYIDPMPLRHPSASAISSHPEFPAKAILDRVMTPELL